LGTENKLSRLDREGRPGTQKNIFSFKHFDSPSRDKSQRGDCHVIPGLIRSENQYIEEEKIKSAKPSVME